MALLVEEERLTGSAARMLGAAIDIDVMEVVLRAALSKAGVLERAAEDGLTMGDVCSGIGTMAAAASRESPVASCDTCSRWRKKQGSGGC